MKAISDSALGRLGELLGIVSPSMQEREMTSYLKSSWGSVAPEGEAAVDAIGNLEFAVRRGDSYPTVALVAHADTICIQITQPVGSGKYRFRSIGCNPHMLLGQRLIVVNEAGGKFDAVVGFDTTSQFGQPKGLVFEDLWIDVVDPRHADSISVGDLAVLRPFHTLSDGFVTSTALDDRLGLFVIGEVLREYSATPLPVNLTCVASVQEEVGLRGSLAFGFRHRPDAVIVLDVDYATDIPTPHEDQMGRLRLGYGPGVLRKADNSPLLRSFIREASSRRAIPLQTSLGRFVYGGTDCTSLQVVRDVIGLPTANITLPLRYMHSPVETASLSDVADAVRLVSGILEDIPEAHGFIPKP